MTPGIPLGRTDMYTLDELRADIESQSWVVLKIEGDRDIDFAYSVGLYKSFGHPELVVFGLPDETMQELINDVGERIEAGAVFTDGDRSGDFLEGYDVAFRAVPAGQLQPRFSWLRDYYERDDVPVMQIVYPDKRRKWPWDAAAGEGFARSQPVLAELPAPSPPAPAEPAEPDAPSPVAAPRGHEA